jgi:hypothetical protein
MNWNNNIIEAEKIEFLPPFVHSMKALFPAKICQIALIAREMENR